MGFLGRESHSPGRESSAPELNLFTLQYRGDAKRYEPRFLAEINRDRNVRMRTIAGLGALLYLFFGFFDFTYPEPFKQSLLIIRYGFTVPMLALFFILTYLRSYPKFAAVLDYALVLTLAFSITAMQLRVSSNDPLVFISILLLQMATVMLLQPRFVTSLSINVSVLLIYLAGDTLFGVHEGILIFRVMLYLFVGGVVASLASYTMEWSKREQFYFTKLMEAQRLKLYEAEKLEAVRAMARAVAHEFNSPLGSILGAYDFAVRPRIDEHQEREQDLLKQIPRSIQRMEVLVSQLLDLTRIEKREYVQGLNMMDIKASSEPNRD